MTAKKNRSRTEYAAKNFMYSTIGSISNSILGFLSRTVFIYTLGTSYLGLSGLFTNVLGMLSLAELGVGTAISFSLYKPLAENNSKKVWAYIDFYKKAYRLVAFVVASIGLALIPFLKYIIKGAEGIDNITLMYCIFLFNTVSSYLISYRTTVLSADQRNYLQTNINTVFNVIMNVFQMIVLVITRNYICYLLTQAVIQFSSKIYLNYYAKKMYPYLKEKHGEELSKEEKSTIYKKIKALIMHKVGEVSINQTDNIIISSFISIKTVGLVSNFTLIINLINTFVNSFFNSAIAGFGNIISTETEERRLKAFKKYDFLGFWFYGWTSICLFFLLKPFVTIWIGEDKLIDSVTLALLCTNYYFTGQRIPIGNVKVAAGVYEQDVWIPFVQSFINIIVSIYGAMHWGLKGVYIGTLLSSLVPNLVRPFVVYKAVFKVSSWDYYKIYIQRIAFMLFTILSISAINYFFYSSNIYLNSLILFALCIIIPNIYMVIFYRKTEGFIYVKSIVIGLVKKVLKKF